MKKHKQIKFFIFGMIAIIAGIVLSNFINATTSVPVPTSFKDNLKSLSLKSDYVKPGGDAYVNLDLTGDKSKIAITAKFVCTKDTNKSFTIPLKALTLEPYFTFPSNIKDGEIYEMAYVTMTQEKSTANYTTRSGETSLRIIKYPLDYKGRKNISVTTNSDLLNPEELVSRFKGLYLDTSSIHADGNVSATIDIKGDKAVNLNATFVSTTDANKSFVVELNQISSDNSNLKPYFHFPKDLKIGEKYEMVYITLKKGNTSVKFTTRAKKANERTTMEYVPYVNCLEKKYVNITAKKSDIDPEGLIDRFKGLYLETSSIHADGNVSATIDITGDKKALNLDATFVSTTDAKKSFVVPLNQIDSNSKPYFQFPKNLNVGDKYEMVYITLKKGNTSVKFTTRKVEPKLISTMEYIPYINCLGKKYVDIVYNQSLVDPEGLVDRFKGLYLETSTIHPDGNVSATLDIKGSNTLNLDATFISTTDPKKSFVVELNQISSDNPNNKPYFHFPKDLKVGDKYEMVYITLTKGNSKVKFTTRKLDPKSISIAEYIAYANCLDKKYVTIKEKEVPLADISVEEFKITGSSSVNVGEKIPVTIKMTGNIKYFVVNFYNPNINSSITAYVQDLKTNPYFVLQNTSGSEIKAAEYYLKDIKLMGEDGSKKTVQYSNQSVGIDIRKLPFDLKILVNVKEKDAELADITLENFKITGSSTVNANEKIPVTIKTTGKIKTCLVTFYNTQLNSSISAYVQDLKTNPYIILQNQLGGDVKQAEYYLKDVFIFGEDGSKKTVQYSNQTVSSYVRKLKLDIKLLVNIKVKEEPLADITMENFKITGKSNVTVGEKIPVTIKTTGNIKYFAVNFYNPSLNSSITAYVQDLKGKPYFIIQNQSGNEIKQAEYYLKDIFIFGEDGSKNNVQYSNQSVGTNIRKLTLDSKILVETKKVITPVKDPEEPIEEPTIKPIIEPIKQNFALDSVSLSTDVANKTEKIEVNIGSNLPYKKVMMSFTNLKNDKTMTVYLQGIKENKPYFIIPYTTDPDDYSLNYMIVTDKNDKIYHFSKNNKGMEDSITQFNFNNNLKIQNIENIIELPKEPTDPSVPKDPVNVLYLENDKITRNILRDISEINSNMVITIDANRDSIIKAEIFSSIKGTNKTIIIQYADNEWIFNGNDIKEVKDIDVSFSINDIVPSLDTDLYNMLKKGISLKFANNGELPGKALIRLKRTDVLFRFLGSEKAYIYYYDATGKKLDKVAMEMTLSDDDYYEFYINHNSTFVISNEKIDDTYVSDKTADLDLNANLNGGNFFNDKVVAYYNKNATVIIIATTFILLVIIGAFIISRRRDMKKMK